MCQNTRTRKHYEFGGGRRACCCCLMLPEWWLLQFLRWLSWQWGPISRCHVQANPKQPTQSEKRTLKGTEHTCKLQSRHMDLVVIIHIYRIYDRNTARAITSGLLLSSKVNTRLNSIQTHCHTRHQHLCWSGQFHFLVHFLYFSLLHWCYTHSYNWLVFSAHSLTPLCLHDFGILAGHERLVFKATISIDFNSWRPFILPVEAVSSATLLSVLLLLLALTHEH